MQLLVPIVIAVLGPVDVRSHLPPQLQQVMQSREAHTSQIEWTVTYLHGREAGLVERHITRTVDDTVWQVNLGDENGFHKTVYGYVPEDNSEESWREAAVPKEELAGPYHSLIHDGDLWYVEHQKHVPPVSAFAAPVAQSDRPPPTDFRAAGIGPWWSQYRGMLGVGEHMLEGFEDATYSITSHGNIETVTGQFNEYTIEWQLDKSRGNQPVHAVFYSGDTVISSSYTELTEIDGRWFPRSIKFHRRDQADPHLVIDVQAASFDKPGHAQEITVDDIGVLFGTQVPGPDGIRCWDGAGLIPYDEYAELVYVFGAQPDPIIVKGLAEAGGMTVQEYTEYMDKTSEWMRAAYRKKHGEAPWLAEKENVPDDWDLYVAAFIRKHKLDEPRVKRANNLLERSKKLRDYRLHKSRAVIKEAQREGNTAKLAHFDKVVQRIFKRILVRGLHKLIPREQRRAG